MNVNDIKSEEVPQDIWKAIFEKQLQLAHKYTDIEEMGDLLETTDSNVDTQKGQIWIKDFSWRVTEELTEADEALKEMNKIVHVTEEDEQKEVELLQHYQEELIDGLHFLTELSIIAGFDEMLVYTSSKFNEVFVDFPAESYDVIYHLGLMCNCLKNKKWKQSQMLTDRPKFINYLMMVWASMISLLESAGLDSNEKIYDIYTRKNGVNNFRIRSKY